MTLEELRKGLTRIGAAMAPLEAELSVADNPKIFLDAALVRELRADPGHAALLQGEMHVLRERINHLVNRLEMLDSVVRIVGGGEPPA